jgi:hypothetical protein
MHAGPILRAHRHAIERRQGQAPAMVRGDAGGVHAHGGAVDRARSVVRARRPAEDAAVPHRLPAGLYPRLVPYPPPSEAQGHRSWHYYSSSTSQRRQFSGKIMFIALAGWLAYNILSYPIF